MKIYLVGGAVRDHLLGRPCKDKDYVVVGATEQDMLALGYTKVGADFPVYLDKNGQEFALARQERKVGHGYRGFETHFDTSVTLEDDLVRRDLTINAMAMDLDTGEIIDPYGGQEDLKTQTLRHVSSSFVEDPLRVLRVARFCARYAFRVDIQTLDMMKQLVEEGELNHLTPERVWSEVERAVMEPYSSRFFAVLSVVKANAVLFPAWMGDWGGHVKDFLNEATENNESLYVRLGVLFSMTTLPSDRTEMYEKYKMSNVAQEVIEKYFIMKYVAELPITPKIVLDAFKRMDVIRHSIFLHTTKKIMKYTDPYLASELNKWQKMLDAIVPISFGALTKEQQETLKGKEIKEAIDQLRLNKIEELLATF